MKLDHPIDFPDPVEAIEFRMEQEGLKQKDLVEILGGSKSRISELLNRKRGLTLPGSQIQNFMLCFAL